MVWRMDRVVIEDNTTFSVASDESEKAYSWKRIIKKLALICISLTTLFVQFGCSAAPTPKSTITPAATPDQSKVINDLKQKVRDLEAEAEATKSEAEAAKYKAQFDASVAEGKALAAEALVRRDRMLQSIGH